MTRINVQNLDIFIIQTKDLECHVATTLTALKSTVILKLLFQ